jgi:hypothetical protein
MWKDLHLYNYCYQQTKKVYGQSVSGRASSISHHQCPIEIDS